LIDTDLGDLLHQLGSAFTGRTNVPVAVNVTGQRALEEHGGVPGEVQVAFYRVCQEGLTNIAKHAKAGQVAIHLCYGPDVVELRLCDDGCGFDPAHISPGRSGLSMMRERAEAVGAILSIASQPGQGAEIAIHWTRAPEQEAS
jgi:signal transduction histidine kinase